MGIPDLNLNLQKIQGQSLQPLSFEGVPKESTAFGVLTHNPKPGMSFLPEGALGVDGAVSVKKGSQYGLAGAELNLAA